MIKGRYDLTTENWDIGNIKWDVVYLGPDENGLMVGKRTPLHPNGYNDAEVDKECHFIIKSVPNLHNGGEWEDMAIVVDAEVGEATLKRDKLMKLTDHIKSIVGVGDFGGRVRPVFPPDRTFKTSDIKIKLYNQEQLDAELARMLGDILLTEKVQLGNRAEIEEYVKNYRKKNETNKKN